MSEFIVIAILVAVLIYGLNLYGKNPDSIAIKLRKDGKYDYERISSKPESDFPMWIKITIFILLASVLFIPLDFILNRY